jgi:peptidylprolyl isomerase
MELVILTHKWENKMTHRLIISLAFMVAGMADLEAKKASKVGAHPVAVIKTNYGLIEVQLFPEVAPKATENFIGLAKSGSYNDCPFHRIISNFMIQGGDFTNKDGTGGRSIWGTYFQDEFSDNVLFDKPGRLAMANKGKDTNGSQFFITTVPTPWLNKKHSIFGQVVKGFETVKKIESLGSHSGQVSQPWFGKKVEQPKILTIEII